MLFVFPLGKVNSIRKKGIYLEVLVKYILLVVCVVFPCPDKWLSKCTGWCFYVHLKSIVLYFTFCFPRIWIFKALAFFSHVRIKLSPYYELCMWKIFQCFLMLFFFYASTEEINSLWRKKMNFIIYNLYKSLRQDTLLLWKQVCFTDCHK